MRAAPALLLLLARPGYGCTFNAPNEGQPQGCFEWDLSAVAAHTWRANTSTCPRNCNTFLIGGPCRLADKSQCRAGLGDDAPATAYQVSNADGSCYSLGSPGSLTFEQLDPGNATAGLIVTSKGGQKGRVFVYRLQCGPAGGAPGSVVENPSMTYTTTWIHPAGCPVFKEGEPCPAPVTPPPAPPPPYTGATPTAPQLAYARSEIRGLMHFNMATFAGDGDPGCNSGNWNKGVNSSNPASFAPMKVDPNQWFESMQVLGIKNLVITAKHGCGHLLWPTETKLPGGKEYTYCVGKKDSAIQFDLLGRLRDDAQKAGIGIGFYYSMTNNFFMNVAHLKAQTSTPLPGQVSVTQQEFEAIALSQLTELWTRYGNLTELWFDGTYPVDMHENIKNLIIGKQPGAVVWNGLGMYSSSADNRISNNGIRWIGTESGEPNGEIWSTARQGGDFSGKGDPDSPVWAPPGCDFSIQNRGRWFFTPPGSAIQSLAGLITRYHETVGRNCVIEVDFAVGRDGLVDPAHAARYKEWGEWIRGCYGAPPSFADRSVANASAQLQPGQPANLVLTLPSSAAPTDRVMIQEDQAQGQRIRKYHVDVLVGGTWSTFSSGTSVGNKRIDVGKTATATAFRLVIDQAAAYPIHVSNFAAFAPCPSS